MSLDFLRNIVITWDQARQAHFPKYHTFDLDDDIIIRNSMHGNDIDERISVLKKRVMWTN